MTEDSNQDIRWQQRFAHFRKAFSLLEQTITIAQPSDAERAGFIQFLGMSFNPGWNA